MSDRLTKWSNILLSIAQTVGIIYSLVIAVRALHASQAQTSADTTLKFEQLFNSPTNRKILIAIEHDKPILEENKGTLTTDDLDNYLGDLSFLDDAYDSQVIDQAMAYEEFPTKCRKPFRILKSPHTWRR